MKVAIISLPFWPTEFPLLGTAYLSAALKSEGIEVKSYDINAELAKKFEHLKERSPWSTSAIINNEKSHYFKSYAQPLIKKELTKILKNIIREDYDFIGFSITSLSFFTTLYFASLLKKLSPSTLLFCGGPEASYDNKHIQDLVRDKIFHIIFEGESEETVVNFFSHIKEGTNYQFLPGTITIDNILQKKPSKKAPLVDYSKLIFPNFEDLDLLLYQQSRLPIMMSRGCIAACSFCTEVISWKKFRIRKAESIVDEIRVNIKKYNISDFFFCDSLINGNIEILDELCSLLIKTETKCTWTAFCRVDIEIDQQLAHKMYQAGCRELSVGYESGSQKVLDLMNKGTTVKAGHHFTQSVSNAGIHIHGLFLLGFPGEDETDFYDTLRFIHKNRDKIFKISTGYTLGISNQSIIGRRPEKYGVLTDDSGNISFDNNGEWLSANHKTDPTTRYYRLEKLRNYLDAFQFNWGPKRGETDIDINRSDHKFLTRCAHSNFFLGKIIYKVSLRFIYLYYLIILKN